MSYVTYHMLQVMCHMSRVMCNFFFFFKYIGGATWWRVNGLVDGGQRGLPRLVNRPSVAKAVLQTPLSIFFSMID